MPRVAVLALVLQLAHQLLARRINFREWRMDPAGRDGACMTRGSNTGTYDEYWSVSEQDCATACTELPMCIAYEYAVLKGGYTRCGVAPMHARGPPHPNRACPAHAHTCAELLAREGV